MKSKFALLTVLLFASSAFAQEYPLVPIETTREFDTTFMPSEYLVRLVSYSISINCVGLEGSASGTVELRSDTNTTPTAVRVTVASGVLNSDTKQLTYIVPAGYKVRLVTSGDCTKTIVSQVELPLH